MGVGEGSRTPQAFVYPAKDRRLLQHRVCADQLSKSLAHTFASFTLHL